MSDNSLNTLSWIVAVIAILAFVDPWLSYCHDLVALGTAFVAFGALFVLAYFRAESSKVLRFLIWISELFTTPSFGKVMAIFWCFFFVLLGAMALVQGFGLADISGFHRSRIAFDNANTQRVSCGQNAIAR
jgi:hypothetical protein